MQRCIIMFFAVLFAAAAPAQDWERRPERGMMMERGMEFFRYQALTLIDADSSMARIDIPFRIENGFFVPVKNDDRSFAWPFKRQGEVLFELLDSLGVSKARKIISIEVGAAVAERPPEAREWFEGLVSFTVPPGRYTIVAEVTDQESKRSFLEKTRTVRAGSAGRGNVLVTTPFFAQGVARQSDSLALMNMGGDVLFGKPAHLVIEIPGAATRQNASVQWTISAVEESDRDSSVVKTGSLQEASQLPGVVLSPLSSGAGYTVSTDAHSHAVALFVPLPVESLPLRRYRLSVVITQGSSTLPFTVPFRTVWPDMPLSLKDIDYALDALRLIVSEQTLDSLKSGNMAQRRDQLEAFWKARDASPETAFNEIETQYYRRVDYAVRQFATLKERDGSQTDRGKVFILYGPPSKTERRLDPSAPFQEIWTYDKVGKKFVFVDQARSGNYVLETTPAQ